MNSQTFEFKLMTFNIEYGGTQVSFENVVKVIQTANPHVVAIEEAFGNIPRLAAELGWAYYDIRLQLVSQLPLLDPPNGDGIYTFVQIAPGKVVAVSNVHLPNDPEGSFAIMKGATAQEIVELEMKARMPFIRTHLDVLQRLASTGMPVFLAGDFNAPSHLDWGADMVGVRKQIKFPMEWSVSKAVELAGFRDSFRDVHPDPKVEPGLTWWASRPQVTTGWNPKPDDPQDRIDFIYALGSSVTLSSVVIGEESVSPYPTDHRAVLSTFAVTPAETPVLVSTNQRRIEVGELIHVWVQGTGTSGERCEVMRLGEPQPLMSQFVEQATSTISFSSNRLSKGAYELVLKGADASVLARYPFWVMDAGETVHLRLEQSSVRAGEPLQATWENAPGNRWDWLGLYKAGQNPLVDKSLQYIHTNANITGTCQIDTSGLDADAYEVLFCIDDNYICLARVWFEVRE